MSHLNTAPETKAAGTDLALAFEDLRYTLENYRATNEERLAGLESRQSVDPLTEEKLVRMDAALDDTMRRIDRLTLERARPALGQDGPRDPLTAEHKAAFASYVRTGEAGGLKRLESKALSAGSGPDGGKNLVVLRKAGEDDNLGLGADRTDLASGFDPVHSWHHQIHKHDMGSMFFNLGYSLDAVLGLAHDLDVIQQIEIGSQSLPNNAMIIHDQDLDSLHCFALQSLRRPQRVRPRACAAHLCALHSSAVQR